MFLGVEDPLEYRVLGDRQDVLAQKEADEQLSGGLGHAVKALRWLVTWKLFRQTLVLGKPELRNTLQILFEWKKESVEVKA